MAAAQGGDDDDRCAAGLRVVCGCVHAPFSLECGLAQWIFFNNVGFTHSDPEVDAALPADVDPVTSRRRNAPATRPVWASEEEREASAEELARLLRRLNDLGVIKCNVPGVTD